MNLASEHTDMEHQNSHKFLFIKPCSQTLLNLTVVSVLITVSFFVSVFSLFQKQVYAGEQGQAVPQSLRGSLNEIISCASRMKEYSRNVQYKTVSAGDGELLVGAEKVSNGLLIRKTFQENVKKASALGSEALETIREHQISYDDYMSLLHIVEAEATGGDLLSRELVADVVLNRVKDSRFPDNVVDVVWQTVDGYAQFSPTTDGRINSCSVSEKTVEAVRKAMDEEDKSQGALFFVARDGAASDSLCWFDTSLNFLFEYGGHEYYTFKDQGDS